MLQEPVAELDGVVWRLNWMSDVFWGEVYLIVAVVAVSSVCALLAIRNHNHLSLPFHG